TKVGSDTLLEPLNRITSSAKSDIRPEIVHNLLSMNLSATESNWTTSVADDSDYSYIIACGYVFVQTGICAVGFVLNVLNFVVFVQATFRAPTYIMMTFLSLADAVTLGFRIPQGYVFFPIVSEHNSDAVLYVYVYSTYVEVPLTNMSENISAWLTVALAIERYVTMKHWSTAKRYFTIRNTRLLVLVIFLIAVVFNTPYFATQIITLSRVNGTLELKSELTGFSHTIYYAVCTYLRIVLVQIIPLCFLCISNCLLFALVSQHNQRFSRHQRCAAGGTPVKGRKPVSRRKTSCDSFLGTVSVYECPVNTNETCSIQQKQAETSEPIRIVSVTGSNGESSHLNTSPVKSRYSDLSFENKTIPCSETERNTSSGAKQRKQERPSVEFVQHSSLINNNVQSESNHSVGKLDRSQKRRATQNKLTILLIAVILLFLIGQVPQSLAYIRVFATLRICSTNQLEHCTAHQLYRMITVNLSHLAFTLNFFVYFFLNRDFRNTLTSCSFARFHFGRTN
ncbi:putative G-protein coupled receptor, partial [Fasciola gigantica]